MGTDDVDDVENRETRIAEALEALLKSRARSAAPEQGQSRRRA